MEGSDFLLAGVLFLFAAVAAVPLASRLGIGAVLGYLLAGIAIGPWGLGFISDVDEILHFSELGVVFLMFIIGLELNPSKLWQLRRSIFGVGAAQVLLSAALLATNLMSLLARTTLTVSTTKTWCNAFLKTYLWALMNCRLVCVSWLKPTRVRYRLKSLRLKTITSWLMVTTCWPVRT